MTTQCSSYPAEELDDEECGESAIHEELELLEAIYVNELTLHKDDRGWPSCISVRLHPATGDVEEQQYVCLTLELSPPHDYPMSPPGITIRNPRGLADEHINSLHKTLEDLAEDRLGYPMLYELIECAKDSLTQGNVPHGHCVICRDDFNEEVEFTRTACYHYFHSDCLLRYVKHCLSQTAEDAQHDPRHSATADKQVVCPICRGVITYDLSALENVKMNPSCNEVFRPNASVRKLQHQMAALFKKQVAKGGIIDVEAERVKFLVPEGPVPLPSVQEDVIGVTDIEASWSSEPPINVTSPPSGHQTKHRDFRNRKFSNFSSRRGRGRGRERGQGREVGRDVHISDGDGHVGGRFSGRRRNGGNVREGEHDMGRNERNLGEDEHDRGRNERNVTEDEQDRGRNLREGHDRGRNERNVREDQIDRGRHERNIREGHDRGRNERNLGEDQHNKRSNETNVSQNNETRNMTNLVSDERSARRTATDLRVGHNSAKNDTNSRGSQRIAKMIDTNLESQQHGRSDTQLRDGKQFDGANDDSPLGNHQYAGSSSNHREKSEMTRMPSNKGISRTENERSNFSVPSSHTDTLPRDRPQSANKRGARGRGRWISRGSDQRNNLNPNPRCKVDYSGINDGARKTTECCGNRKGTSACGGERERTRGGSGSFQESPRDSSGKCTPPGFQTSNRPRPPPGFGKSSVRS